MKINSTFHILLVFMVVLIFSVYLLTPLAQQNSELFSAKIAVMLFCSLGTHQGIDETDARTCRTIDRFRIT